MSSFRAKVDLEKYEEMKAFYLPYVVQQNDDYLDFRSEYQGLTITGYLSNKDKRTISFRGDNAEIEAAKWGIEVSEVKTKQAVKSEWICLDNQIGSDEVGVGDFLLPMIVVAAYVRKGQMSWLKSIGIDDSKKMNDDKIREVAPLLLQKISYSKLTLPNQKYNEMYDKGQNINSLKAKMHNRALANMKKSHTNVANIFIDEFASEKTYYSYLDIHDEPIVKGLTFKTKGESYYPCVACASVIARYSLLLEKDKLSKKYGLEFLAGASAKVDKLSKALLDKIGKEEFEKLIKKNFKNYNRIIDEVESLV